MAKAETINERRFDRPYKVYNGIMASMQAIVDSDRIFNVIYIKEKACISKIDNAHKVVQCEVH